MGMPGLTDTEERHFWARTRQDKECWEWQGACSNRGYGVVKLHGVQWYAHRIAWVLGHGPIPVNHVICHRCDNPRCCRPSHLFLGTAADNAADRDSKGRDGFAHGEVNGQAVLRATDVRAIRDRHAAGDTQIAIARAFGVSKMTISLIVRRKRWAHVE
jgi:hypothetical protein